MTHDVAVFAAECAECKKPYEYEYIHPEWRQTVIPAEHLQAQKDALYAAMKVAFGPEPIKYLTSGGIGTKFFASELTALADALLNGLGMPPQEHELQILTTKELRAQMEAKK